jgi:hypothetical protein
VTNRGRRDLLKYGQISTAHIRKNPLILKVANPGWVSGRSDIRLTIFRTMKSWNTFRSLTGLRHHEEMNGNALPPSFDPIYFSAASWDDRVEQWIASAAGQEFADDNARVVRQVISDPDSGLVVIVNIGTCALLKLLPDGRYLNLYERPAVGGKRKQVSQERIDVDQAMGINGPDVYFAALALGGSGIRFYGEYCLVLTLDKIDSDPQMFDRDSYDVLQPPFTELPNPQVLIQCLIGRWDQDRYAMTMMKVLPGLDHQHGLVTTGTVSEAVLKDQEYIELHLHPARDSADVNRPGVQGGFGRGDIEELRESPDEVAVATRLRERSDDGLLLTEVEYEWLQRRENVTRTVAATHLPARVVTQHGRGYQWK